MGLHDDYTCFICNKKYSCRQNLHRHNKRFHPKITPKCSIQEQNYSKQHQAGVKIVNNNETGDKEFFCDFCKKSFSRKYNLIRHLKLNRCVKLKDIENENLLLKKENEELKNKYKEYDEEIKNLKDQLLDVMNKQCKMHHQTFNKIQNQLINNNEYNNCTFNIVQLGQEDLVNTLSEKEQLKVLNKKYKSLNYLIDYIHCNEKFPEFNNVIITNLQNNIAYMYDKEKKTFYCKEEG